MYTGYVNARARKTGHLWRGRFGSAVMDEAHLYEAVRYVSLNPVRAGLVDRAQDWQWSSVNLHLKKRDDRSFKCAPVLERVGNFRKYLTLPFDETEAFAQLRVCETTGRPPGGHWALLNGLAIWKPKPVADSRRKKEGRRRREIKCI